MRSGLKLGCAAGLRRSQRIDRQWKQLVYPSTIAAIKTAAKLYLQALP